MAANNREYFMAKILVVEDYPPLAATLGRLLRSRGFDVTCAFNATTGSNTAGNFAYALLDIDLPDGNGVCVAEHLLHHRRAPCVVFFTASQEEELLTRARYLGPVVQKSQGTQRLLEVFAAQQMHTQLRRERFITNVEATPIV